MLQIKLKCPSCATEHLVPSAFEGKKISCGNPGCGTLIDVIEPNPVHFKEAPPGFDGNPTPNEPGLSQQVRSTYVEPVVEKQTPNHWSFLGRALYLLGLVCLTVATVAPSQRATVEILTSSSSSRANLILIAISLLISGALFWTAGKQSPGKLESRLIVLLVGMIVLVLAIQTWHSWVWHGHPLHKLLLQD